MNRQRMTQAMRALDGNAETAFPNHGSKSFGDSRGLHHADGSAHCQEDISIGRWWWSPLQKFHQRTRDFIGQRQFQRRCSFALVDSQTVLSPTNIIEGDGCYLAAPQSVGRHQQKHRVVAQSLCRGSVNGPKKRTNCLPGEGAWQLLVTVQAWRIDLAGQALWSSTVRCQKSKEFPQHADLVMESCPAQALASFADVGFDLGGLDRFQSDALFIQVLEKALRCSSLA